MSLVVADTSPMNYLVLCEVINVLPAIYTQVVIPSGVFEELNHQRTPPQVRFWVNALPSWVAIQAPRSLAPYPSLGRGEREAIALAKELSAIEVLMDERLARAAAVHSGLLVTGTIGVLEEAAARNLIDLRLTFEKLRKTNFRCEDSLLEAALDRVEARKPDR